jgi:hypothetical protein
MTMEARKITKNDFRFRYEGSGFYSVFYFCPETKKSWWTVIHDRALIIAVICNEEPEEEDLIKLKEVAKKGIRSAN